MIVVSFMGYAFKNASGKVVFAFLRFHFISNTKKRIMFVPFTIFNGIFESSLLWCRINQGLHFVKFVSMYSNLLWLLEGDMCVIKKMLLLRMGNSRVANMMQK